VDVRRYRGRADLGDEFHSQNMQLQIAAVTWQLYRNQFCLLSNYFGFCLFAAENTALTYEIADGVAEDKFTINSTTGLITTTAPLDRETRDSWTVTGYYY